MNSDTSTNIAAQLAAAIGLHGSGQLSQAQAIYEHILRVDPGQGDVLQRLALIAYQQKRFGEAVAFLDRAIAAAPENAAFHANRGAILHEMKQLEAAIADYDKAIAINPGLAEAYNNRGNARQKLKQLDAAIADYSNAIEVRPDYAEAYNNRGVAQRELEKLDAAIADYDKAIALKPDFAEAYNNRGLVQRALKKIAAAIADYDRAIALRADFADAYHNRGVARQELKQLDAAIANYNTAIALKPDYAEVYNNRGLARQDLKQLKTAIADYDRAIAINPDLAEAYNNRGNAQQELRQIDAALADYEKAIVLSPRYAEVYYNRGNALRELSRLDAAIADYDRAVAIAPDYAEAHWNKALTLLAGGDLAAGFALFEWRWKNPQLKMVPRRFAQPLWLGDAPLQGKTILLHSEQGFGDTIQFCRYAALLAGAGAQVILEVPPPLAGLLKSLAGVSRFVAQGEPLPDFDFHCPLMSLPLAFKTEIATIPDPTPYLSADPAKARAWQERIGERKNLKVGVVWSGGFRPSQPEVWAVNERRNIPLDAFARALGALDADFFSLQKGDPAEAEIRGREAEYWPRGNFHNFGGDLNDFADTAALIANLDLVVTVDTSTAHLAAALGKPTWILNRFDTCWRWLLDRDDSPWYRSVKLYRQDDSQNWEPVLRRVAADLAKLADERRS